MQTALDAAGGKNAEGFSSTIGRQLLARGLIDEVDLHIAPILLGEGIRLYDKRIVAASCSGPPSYELYVTLLRFDKAI